jgi:hypothetical protein
MSRYFGRPVLATAIGSGEYAPGMEACHEKAQGL